MSDAKFYLLVIGLIVAILHFDSTGTALALFWVFVAPALLCVAVYVWEKRDNQRREERMERKVAEAERRFKADYRRRNP